MAVVSLDDTEKEAGEKTQNTDEDEWYIGKKFDTHDDLFRSYKAYAKREGFAVIKRTNRRNEVGIIRSMMYVCNRAGNPVNKTKNISKRRKSNCCDCKAYITARLDDEDKWEISQLKLDHNHTYDPSLSRHYRQHRKVEPHVLRTIDLNDQSGIPMEKTFRSVVNQYGGYDKVDCSEKDCRNALAEIRRLRLGEGDATALMKYFSKKVKENSGFYFEVDYDDENQLRNVFWADGWSREAYKEFGEVISFDATYMTNDYEMPFTSFFGVNHHGQSIFLGCGLLCNETTETFVRLFKKWLKCMFGCAPREIITDQCQAMKNAVEIIFPEARHRWCLWHIMKKIPEKFGSYKQGEKIAFALQEAVYDSQTPAEFEESWKKMIDKYNLQQNTWLSNLYPEKEQWLPCFLKDTFWAGMASTQHRESINAFFKGYVNSKTKLKQFVELCEQALRAKVEKELKEDAESCTKAIPLISSYPFEKQLRDMYTLVKFQEFQKEIRGKIACEVVDFDEVTEVHKYVIREDIWLDNDFCKKVKFNVTFRKIETNDDSSEEEDGDIAVEVVDDGEGMVDLETDNESETDDNETNGSETESSGTDDSEKEECVFDKRTDETEATKAKKRKKLVDFDIHCSCQMFESRGILCKHVIVVLMRNGIRLIPEKYILRRWRKNVTRPHTKLKVSFSCWELNEQSLRYNQMCLKFSVLADLASVNDKESKVVNEWLDNRTEELKAKSIELEKIKINAEDQGDTSAPSYGDPSKKKRRGRKRTKRLKSKRSWKRTKRNPSTKPSQESVTTPTPSNPHDISHQQHTEATRG
ncbi:protein FAR1-RELATED SEQUENCE 4-like [Papaver somniferum]|uniref:protein FAR1-RELATED SEQUENCE 4-like n=1 Tax=Papaver somniferum TaxID=3469 RepID=UPI000E6F7497|nr:protein FAR1-RELATED SEQUENCE 4-like [Papaver somniferum]